MKPTSLLILLLACDPQVDDSGTGHGQASQSIGGDVASAAFSGLTSPVLGILGTLVQEAENDALNAQDRGETVCPAMTIEGDTVTFVGGCTGHSGVEWAGRAVVSGYPTSGWWNGEVETDIRPGEDYTLELESFGTLDGFDDALHTGSVTGSWPDPDVEFHQSWALETAWTGPSFSGTGTWVADRIGEAYALGSGAVSVEGGHEFSVSDGSMRALYGEAEFALAGENGELVVDLGIEARNSPVCHAAHYDGHAMAACWVGTTRWVNESSIARDHFYQPEFAYADCTPAEDYTLLAATTHGDVAAVTGEIAGRESGDVEPHPLDPYGQDGDNAYWHMLLVPGSAYVPGESTAYAGDANLVARFLAYDEAGSVVACAYDGTDASGASAWFADAGCP